MPRFYQLVLRGCGCQDAPSRAKMLQFAPRCSDSRQDAPNRVEARFCCSRFLFFHFYELAISHPEFSSHPRDADCQRHALDQNSGVARWIKHAYVCACALYVCGIYMYIRMFQFSGVTRWTIHAYVCACALYVCVHIYMYIRMFQFWSLQQSISGALMYININILWYLSCSLHTCAQKLRGRSFNFATCRRRFSRLLVLLTFGGQVHMSARA
jgi:hypothetical protein